MQENQTIVPAEMIDDDVPAWKRLESVMKVWAIQSQLEQQLENYEKLQSQNK